MHQSVVYLGLVTVAVPVVTSLTWILGLMITLRGSTPRERAGLLRAYGASLPKFRTRRAPTSESSQV